MDTGLIAKRYASALVAFAAQNGEEQRVYDEVNRLIAVLRDNPSIRTVFCAPVLPEADKETLFRQIMQTEVSHTFSRFVSLVASHRRGEHLWFILHAYIALYKVRHKILDATLTTAAPLSEETLERIAGIIRVQVPGYDVRLDRKTDPALIGGFIFRLNDLYVDASLSRQLGLLRRQFGNVQNRII